MEEAGAPYAVHRLILRKASIEWELGPGWLPVLGVLSFHKRPFFELHELTRDSPVVAGWVDVRFI